MLGRLLLGEFSSAWIFMRAGMAHPHAAQPDGHEFTERTSQRQMLLGRKLLVSEKDDEVLEEGPLNFFQLPASRPFGKIDAVKLCSNHRCELINCESLVGALS